jgi:copper chaperone CopZ
MKKMLVSAIAIMGLSFFGLSQIKPILTAVIKTPNALCINCKTRIENCLKGNDGILEVKVNYRAGETKVKYITDRIYLEAIQSIIASCGYDADDVPADEKAYKKLPLACKKPEDGGGHKKPKTAPPPQ